MFCIKCGKVLEPSAKICPDCGTKVVLPEGFEADNGAGNIDIDMLIGEKTVSADHGALARKAAAAANAQAAPEAAMPATAASEPIFAAPAPIPVAEPAVPHSPAGFDLDKAKKIMNGRSILIDDSPEPSAMPAASYSVAASAKMSEPAPSDKKTKLVIIIAAIVAVLAILGAVLAVAFSDKGEDEKSEKPSETEIAQTTAPEETTTKLVSAIGSNIPELYLPSDEAAQDITDSTGEETEISQTPAQPSAVNPENAADVQDDEENTTKKDEEATSGNVAQTEPTLGGDESVNSVAENIGETENLQTPDIDED